MDITETNKKIIYSVLYNTIKRKCNSINGDNELKIKTTKLYNKCINIITNGNKNNDLLVFKKIFHAEYKRSNDNNIYDIIKLLNNINSICQNILIKIKSICIDYEQKLNEIIENFDHNVYIDMYIAKINKLIDNFYNDIYTYFDNYMNINKKNIAKNTSDSENSFSHYDNKVLMKNFDVVQNMKINKNNDGVNIHIGNYNKTIYYVNNMNYNIIAIKNKKIICSIIGLINLNLYIIKINK